jgi:hypothetical protein
MRQITGVIICLIVSVSLLGQENYAQQIAAKAGICDGYGSTASTVSFPCKDCDITFVPLAPQRGKDYLFFMEASSPAHCGSGGCASTVYSKNGSGYQALTHIFGFYERSIARPGQAPDLVFLHVEFPHRDYNNDGRKDKATIRVRYRWNNNRKAFDIIDIISIEVYNQQINTQRWEKILIKEWQQDSPWVN